jgi:hypothetical protein
MKITLYVLIAIAWLIFNIVKAVRKASKEQASKQPQVPGEMPKAHTAPRRHTTPQHASTSKHQPAIPAYQSQEIIVDEAAFDIELEYNTPHAYETYENNSIESGSMETLEESHGSASPVYSLQGEEDVSEFNLRKAVIYSEILRRPYG